MKTNRKSRAKQRGAAMIEGIVVMTTMLVFLGMNLYAAHVYGGKLDQASSTRRDVLYYASHGCEETNPNDDTDSYTQDTLRGISGQAVDTEQLAEAPTAQTPGNIGSVATGTAGQGITGAVSRDWNTASGGKGPQEVTGSALYSNENSVFVKKHYMTRALGSNSYSACNEKTYNNQWTAFFEFSWDQLKRGAGADVF